MHAHGTVLNGVSQRGRGRRGVIMHQYRVVANGGGGASHAHATVSNGDGERGGTGDRGEEERGGGVLIMHGRSRTTIESRIPATPDRSTSANNRPGRGSGGGGGSGSVSECARV